MFGLRENLIIRTKKEEKKNWSNRFHRRIVIGPEILKSDRKLDDSPRSTNRRALRNAKWKESSDVRPHRVEYFSFSANLFCSPIASWSKRRLIVRPIVHFVNEDRIRKDQKSNESCTYILSVLKIWSQFLFYIYILRLLLIFMFICN